MAADDKSATVARRQQPSRVQIVDQGRGDMVSENRAANDRFRRNSEAKQEQQAGRASAGAEPKPEAKKELSFGPGRAHRQNHGELKQERAEALTKDKGQQQGAKKELSFGAGRGPEKRQQRDQGHGR